MIVDKTAMKNTLCLLGDFYLVNVKYDVLTGLASELLICEPHNFLPGSPFWAKREDVIHLIEDGYNLELLPPEDMAVFKRWYVRVVEVGETSYLRTDEKCIPADSFIRTEC